jgi:hypothetical protein
MIFLENPGKSSVFLNPPAGAIEPILPKEREACPFLKISPFA